jgi:hypothetical protein
MKWDYKLSTYDDPALVTARALQVAMTPPQGPAYLILPKEVGHVPLGGDAAMTTVDRLGVPRTGAGPDDAVDEIARRLLDADHPLLITDRVGRDPRAIDALDELARDFAIAVRATRHRMNLSDEHPSSWAGGTFTSAQTPATTGSCHSCAPMRSSSSSTSCRGSPHANVPHRTYGSPPWGTTRRRSLSRSTSSLATSGSLRTPRTSSRH